MVSDNSDNNDIGGCGKFMVSVTTVTTVTGWLWQTHGFYDNSNNSDRVAVARPERPIRSCIPRKRARMAFRFDQWW